MTEFVVSADGTRIAWERTGSGPALVLVDGALCHRALGPSRPLAAALADRFAVVTYDRRGRGESGDTAPYDVGRELEDLAAVVAATGGSAHLHGISSGAELVLRAAAAGVPARSLALYELPVLADDSRPPAPPSVADDVEAAIAGGRPGRAVATFLTDAVGAPRVVPLVMRLTPMWRRLAAVAPTLPRDLALTRGYETGRPPAARPDPGVPVLVAAGGRSPAWLRNGGRALAASIPGARFVEVPGQNHNVKAGALAPVVAEFLDEAEAVTTERTTERERP